MKRKYECWVYDVCGNEKDGYNVNDISKTSETYELNDLWNDKQIVRSLKEQGCIRKGIHASSIGIGGEFAYMYFEYKGKPDFELVCIQDD